MTHPLLTSIGNLPEWFELMDGYRGAERDRAKYLADQLTAFGDEITDAEWVKLMHAAELLIAEWRARNSITETAASLKQDLVRAAISSNRAA
jgi:hypothetical protein